MANITGVNPPVLNDTDYVDKIYNSFVAIDNHDHTSGKGLSIGTTAIAAGAITDALVNASAAIARTKIASGTASHVLVNNGSGVMSSEAQLAISRGGTGAATQAAGFDALAPTTTKGDLITRNASTNIRVGVGADGLFLKADSAQTSGIIWASATVNFAVSTKTANYTLVGTDDLVLGDATGGIFTLTLPTAVGITGKLFRLKKTDSSTNAITIATTSSQTINGVTTKKLATKDQVYEVISDGANWQVSNMHIPKVEATYTLTVGAATTPPTFGTTTVDIARWLRDGPDMILVYEKVTTTGGSAGTGTYLFPLPSGYLMDTARVTVSTSGTHGNLGSASATTSGTNGLGCVTPYSTSQLAILLTNNASTNLVNDAYFNSGAAVKYAFSARIPISGWDV